MTAVEGPLVVALGGNALQEPGGADSVASDFERTRATVEHLVALAGRGHRLVVTHGNGPQVGNHLLRSELGEEHGRLPALPLEVCVADTQGGMGYMLQQCLTNELAAAGLPAVVASVVTQVVVDRADPAFDAPTKPVGDMIPAARVGELEARGWTLAEDRRRGGWRRVVPSPEPKEMVEAEAIRALVGSGVIVVAAGGGGIPVVQSPSGELQGIEAVVDKDLASALLAIDLKAAGLVIVTDVERVMLGFDSDRPEPVDALPVAEARRHLRDGQFGAGSMAPKVEAACRVIEAGGGLAVITSIDNCAAALDGRAGTRIVS